MKKSFLFTVGAIALAAAAMFGCKNTSGGNNENKIALPGAIGDIALKDGRIVAAADAKPDLKENVSGIVIYNENSTRIIIATESFQKMTFANKDKGALLNATKINELPSGEKPLLKMVGNDAVGNGGFPKANQDWWSSVIKQVLERNGITDLADAEKYPILAKLDEFNKANGGGWFFPGVVACTYISENKDAINTTLKNLGFSELPGGTMTSVLCNGDFFWYPFDVTDSATLITTRDSGAIGVGTFNSSGNFAVIDASVSGNGNAGWYMGSYEVLPIKVLK